MAYDPEQWAADRKASLEFMEQSFAREPSSVSERIARVFAEEIRTAEQNYEPSGTSIWLHSIYKRVEAAAMSERGVGRPPHEFSAYADELCYEDGYYSHDSCQNGGV